MLENQISSEHPVFNYKATLGDFLTFFYFCFNSLLLGCRLTNSSAVFHVWHAINAFSGECLDNTGITPTTTGVWCLEQWESAKIALTLYQSGVMSTALMGETLVETFSASMCLLFSHLMFSGGAYLFSKTTSSRCYFIACLAQGVASELLLHCILPLAALFGPARDRMTQLPTFCHDLSILFYPILLYMGLYSSIIYEENQLKFRSLESILFYLILGLSVLGVILLPIDEDGKIVASPNGFIMQAPNDLEDQSLKVYETQQCLDESETMIQQIHVPTQISLFEINSALFTEDTHEPSRMSTTFFCLFLASGAFLVFQSSFILINHPQLFESLGDDGTLTTTMMWMLTLVPPFNSFSWWYNDRGGRHFRLCFILVLFAAAHGFMLSKGLKSLWIMILFFITAHSLIIPTLLGITIKSFDVSQASFQSVILSLTCGFFNFLNIPLISYVDYRKQGDYNQVSLMLFYMNLLWILVLICHGLFSYWSSSQKTWEHHKDSSQPFKKSLFSPNHSSSPSENNLLGFPQGEASPLLDSENREDEWEDEEYEVPFTSLKLEHT